MRTVFFFHVTQQIFFLFSILTTLQTANYNNVLKLTYASKPTATEPTTGVNQGHYKMANITNHKKPISDTDHLKTTLPSRNPLLILIT